MNLSCLGKSKSSKEKITKPDPVETAEETLQKLALLLAETQSKYQEVEQKA